MILQREVVSETGETVYQFAEIHEGDMFVDRNDDNYWYVSMSGDGADAIPVKVLNGIADDENIEVMPDWEIFEHFRDVNIMRFGEAQKQEWAEMRLWVGGAWRLFGYVERMSASSYTCIVDSWSDDVIVIYDSTPVKVGR